jgi:hypothetical protein
MRLVRDVHVTMLFKINIMASSVGNRTSGGSMHTTPVNKPKLTSRRQGNITVTAKNRRACVRARSRWTLCGGRKFKTGGHARDDDVPGIPLWRTASRSVVLRHPGGGSARVEISRFDGRSRWYAHGIRSTTQLRTACASNVHDGSSRSKRGSTSWQEWLYYSYKRIWGFTFNNPARAGFVRSHFHCPVSEWVSLVVGLEKTWLLRSRSATSRWPATCRRKFYVEPSYSTGNGQVPLDHRRGGRLAGYRRVRFRSIRVSLGPTGRPVSLEPSTHGPNCLCCFLLQPRVWVFFR